MKKIAFFAYNLEIGGAERSLVNLVNYLNNTYQITIYLYDEVGDLLSSLPQNIQVVKLRSNKLQAVFFKYSRLYRRRFLNKKVSHDYDFLVAYVEGRLATIVSEIKSDALKIAWIHTDVSKHNLGISTKEIVSSYAQMAKIVFVSEEARQDFLTNYKIPVDKTLVIPNLIAVAKIREEANKEKIKKNKFTFVNVSRMRQEKRHDLLIAACAILKEKNYDFELWLVGDGPLASAVNKQIQETNLNDVIKVWGLQNNPYPYIQNADCFVLASDYEGQSLVVMEALILRKPVIATDIKVINAVLDNKYGLICEHNAKSLALAMEKMLNKQFYDKINKELLKVNINNDKVFKEVSDLFEKEG